MWRGKVDNENESRIKSVDNINSESNDDDDNDNDKRSNAKKKKNFFWSCLKNGWLRFILYSVWVLNLNSKMDWVKETEKKEEEMNTTKLYARAHNEWEQYCAKCNLLWNFPKTHAPNCR